jgi:hypothetical protein
MSKGGIEGHIVNLNLAIEHDGSLQNSSMQNQVHYFGSKKELLGQGIDWSFPVVGAGEQYDA